MANYRQIHTQIWKDDWFVELSPQEKLLFIYLFSNDNSSLTGIYKISLRVIAFETGMEADYIKSALSKFEADKRVVYRDGVLWIVHMWRYHNNASPLVKARILNDLSRIPDCQIKKAYQYYQDTGIFDLESVSIPTAPSIDTNPEKAKLNLTKLREDDHGDAGGIFMLYENEIGSITKMVAEELKDAEKEYPADWFPLAFREAVNHNARNWKYIHAILKRWKVEGVGGNGKQKEDHPPNFVLYKGEWTNPLNIPTEEI